jgi:ligand-binding sensor domain-containing protein
LGEIKTMRKERVVIFLIAVGAVFMACQGSAEQQHGKKVASIGKVVTTIAGNPTTIFQDQDGHYWFGGAKEGLYQYTPSTDGSGRGNLIWYTQKDGLSGHDIVGIQEDKLGNLYFDSSKGVSKFDGEKFSIVPLNDQVAKNEWKLMPNDLWFRMGWENDGPFRYDGQFLHPLTFPKIKRADEFYAANPNASWSPYGIYSFYQDQRGALWFGTASLGVCRYDGSTFAWLYEEHLSQIPGGGDFGIRSMIEDDKGDFWICNPRYRYTMIPGSTEKEGTNYLNYKRTEGVDCPQENSEEGCPYFMSMVEDGQGNLWMASYDDGVWQNDGQKLIHHPVKVGDEEALIFSIYKDKEGGLWLGTHNLGVLKYNDQAFIPFTP